MRGTLIDISVPLAPGLARWPGDPPLTAERLWDTARGDPCTLSRFALGSHTGTHVDAPRHYVGEGAALAHMPLDATVGPCRVAAFPGGSRVTAADLVRIDPRPGERLLLKTPNSLVRWDREPFDENFVCLDEGGAALLAERRVRTVGIDALSVGRPGPEGDEVHRLLLGAGIWLVEGLWLGGVEPGDYELLCLPLRGPAVDGAPARAVLRVL